MKKAKKPSLKKIYTIDSKKNDVVRVTEFSVSPTVTTPGKQVMIKMTIKNVSEKNIKGVPWQIVKNKKVLAAGIRYNLNPGQQLQAQAIFQLSIRT